MRPAHFLDTNVLLYSISKAPSEVDKRRRAIELLDEDNGAISVQVLQEFYAQATRATRVDPISHEIAAALMKAWSRYQIQDMTLPVLDGALEIRTAYGFSLWDSLILSAARTLGCPILYTEDMNHGQYVDGVRILNPFL